MFFLVCVLCGGLGVLVLSLVLLPTIVAAGRGTRLGVVAAVNVLGALPGVGWLLSHFLSETAAPLDRVAVFVGWLLFLIGVVSWIVAMILASPEPARLSKTRLASHTGAAGNG